MALDALTLSQIREWVGSAPDDDALEDAYTVASSTYGGGTVHGAALSILRARRADLLTKTSWGVPGDYYEGAPQFAAIDGQIAQLEGLLGVGSSVLATGRLSRGCNGR